MNLQDLKNKVEQAKGARNQIQKSLKVIEFSIKGNENRQKAIEEVQALIQITAKETQEKLRYHIQDIVNTALDTCFPGEYDFVVDFQIKRGRTEAELYLLKEGDRVNPMDSTGGGVVDIASLGLRFSAWALSKTDNTIGLDEPFKWLSADLRPLAGEILKALSERLGIQILMITHDEVMIDVADRVFEVTQRKGVSKVEVRG
jgi:DNA repair exonuclease SbcCD ATPase subunit